MASSNLQNRLSQTWLLSQLDEEELERAAEFVHEQTVPASTVLFRQGDAPTHLYLLESGVIEESGIDSAGKEILYRRAEAGDDVGRWGVLQSQPQRATATILREAKLLAIENKDFQTLLAMVPRLRERAERKNIISRLLRIPLFASFTPQELANVADLAREVKYPAGQTIFAEGEEADAFYVIDAGQVEEMSQQTTRAGEIWPLVLTAGHFFGRYALLNNTSRRATARATTDASLFRFSAQAFQWLLRFKPGFGRALARPNVEACLRATDTFKRLNVTELRRLAGYAGLAHLRPGDTLYRQGEIDRTLYILYRGRAIVQKREGDGKETPLSHLKAVQAVGEPSLFMQEPRDATVVATTATDWCYLTGADLDRYLEKYPQIKKVVLVPWGEVTDTPAPRGEVTDTLALRGRVKGAVAPGGEVKDMPAATEEVKEVPAPTEEVKTQTGMKRLPWMQPEEQLVLQCRRHWVFLANSLIGPFLLLLLTLILLSISGSSGIKTLLTALALLAGIAGLLWAAWRLVDWLNDHYYVTTMRVAHQEKTLGIRETQEQVMLDKVQNVNLDQGVLGNYVGFGHLVIETAAQGGVSLMNFTHVPQPAYVQQTIFRQIDALQASEGRASGATEENRLVPETVEPRLDLGYRLSIPRQVTPVDEAQASSEAPQAGTFQRLGDATWKKLFWVERVEGDQVTWRKHWLKLLSVIWLPSLTMAGIVVLLILYLTSSADKSPAILVFLGGLALANLIWLSWNWTNWGNDLYIVTNDRIVDTERLPLGFRSKRMETTFDKIQNVSSSVPTPIATLFHFGTVTIFTAGTQGKLDFVWVKNPQRVQQEIFRRLKAYEEQQRRKQLEGMSERLPEWLATYDSTHRT